jgi:hypothetical protein
MDRRVTVDVEAFANIVTVVVTVGSFTTFAHQELTLLSLAEIEK